MSDELKKFIDTAKAIQADINALGVSKPAAGKVDWVEFLADCNDLGYLVCVNRSEDVDPLAGPTLYTLWVWGENKYGLHYDVVCESAPKDVLGAMLADIVKTLVPFDEYLRDNS